MVLAAHVALNGVDGAFRHLGDVAPGDEVVVRLDDGTERAPIGSTRSAAYRRDALPTQCGYETGPSVSYSSLARGDSIPSAAATPPSSSRGHSGHDQEGGSWPATPSR
jgi:hypothetical protein